MNTKKSSLGLFLLAACLLTLGTSCSTQKNTFPNRAYHTVTSKFNVNFNAKEALLAGESELEKKAKDNYTSILPIYYYPPKNELSSIYPNMDRAIEKASKSIYKHSMMIRGTEYVRTMDDIYLIMGKAYFYKQDYIQAQRIFNYITTTYKGKKWNCREEAMILGVRTGIKQEHYSTALSSLDELQYELYKSKNKKLKVLFNAAAAEYHLTAPDGDIQSAIDYIQEAIQNKPKRNFKTRLYFILGQLYEKTEHLPEAQKYFRLVINRASDYEMEFNAHMHLATNYDGSNQSRSLILKNLHKMLEDKKNVDYKDQIYYAIANIAKKDEDEDEQIKNLALSVAHYTVNDFQRTYGAVELADIFFEREEYVLAQAYYDTALLSLPENYPNKASVISKGNTLKGLVDNLKVISTQDSLQRIAKMSEGERNNWVRRMITIYTEEETRLAREEADRMAALASTAGMANITVNEASGKWYFYNQSLITTGKTEFLRLWGTRKLEDNWRISSKQQISFEEMAQSNNPSLEKEDIVEYDEDGNLIIPRETDPKKPEYYLQDLPLTSAAMDSSNTMIVNALYNAAIIYLDQLNDVKRSSETFEKLIARFPDHDLTLPALYMLYRNYLSINNPKYEAIKNKIITEYPNTDFARLIMDPDYYKRLAEKEKELETVYEEAYAAYSNKQWNTTIRLADKAIPALTDEELMSKFEYIRAVAMGQVFGNDSLKESLISLINQHPTMPVTELARIYLSTLNAGEDNIPTNTTAEQSNSTVQTVESVFVYKPGEMHYIVLIVDVGIIPVSDVRIEISNFNEKFFSLNNFNINSFYIDQAHQMITISKFNNMETAMDYYSAIFSSEQFSSLIKEKDIAVYAIAATNYTTYYNKKEERASYKSFFETYYLNKK